MVSTLKKVVTCIQCQSGAMELYEMACSGTCATKLLFICDDCANSEIFMTIDTKHSDTMNSLDFSSVFGSHLAGLSYEKTNSLYASLNLTPPPSRYKNTKIEKKVVIAAEKEAVASMERAKKELESTIVIDPTTKCVHVSASMDGCYRSSSCFSSAVSTTTGKVIAYKVASNSCLICTRFSNREIAGTLSELDQNTNGIFINPIVRRIIYTSQLFSLNLL